MHHYASLDLFTLCCLQDPISFPTNTDESSNLMVMHVRNNQTLPATLPAHVDSAGDRYSTLPSNIPISLPAHLNQVDHHYAEIRQ